MTNKSITSKRVGGPLHFVKASLTMLSLCFVLHTAHPIFSQPKLVDAMDYDHDNKTDGVVFRASDNTWYIAKSSGGIIATNFGLASSDFVVPGDYDGDEIGDIAVWRDTTGVFHYIRSSDSVYGAIQFGASDDEPVARDYDGDGKTDLAVVRRVDGIMVWYIWRTLDNAVQAIVYGFDYDYVAPGDYDGDGKFDLAVYRPSPNNGQGVFHIQRSTLGYVAVGFGLSNDLVAPGDYDGDGKTDIAVVRDSGGYLAWYLLRSSDWGFVAYTWGRGGGADYPVQGDYDGDGKTDPAVWRTTVGTFFVLRSIDFNAHYIYWGSNGDFPVAYYDIH